MDAIANHRELIDRMGGNAEVARLGGWLPVTVGQWKSQNRIPPDHWPKIIEIAAEKGVSGINSTWLMNRWPPRKNAAGAAEAQGVPA